MIHQKIPVHIRGGNAELVTYILDNSPEMMPGQKKPLILICPGGGYEMTSDREAEPIALQMNAFGFHACVLRYSVIPARYPQALMELAHSTAYIREHAEEWMVDPDRIILMGFSAGGHLAACLGVFWQEGFLASELGVTPQEIKPNGMILAYPVITSGPLGHQGSFQNLLGGEENRELWEKLSLENKVTDQVPPVFLWHTDTDQAVPVENSLLFAAALKKHHIPLEMHIYSVGPHGLALANSVTQAVQDEKIVAVESRCTGWTELARAWIEAL